MRNTSYAAGEPIRDWIYAGPFERDVSERYDSNYRVPTAPYAQELQEAKREAPLGALPQEGEPLALYGQRLRWRCKRSDPAERKLTWARFGIHARLLATYAASAIAVPESGTRRLRVWAAGAVQLWVNGRPVLDASRLGRVEGEWEVEVPLHRGDNRLVVLLFNVHLHCTNSFWLTVEDSACETRLPLLLEPPAREAVEADLAKFYIPRPYAEPHETIRLGLESPLQAGSRWEVTVYAAERGDPAEREPRWRTEVQGVGDALELALCCGDELGGPGEYAICIDALAADVRIEGVQLPLQLTPFVTVEPDASYAGRSGWLQAHYASEALARTNVREHLYRQVMRLRAGGPGQLETERIEATIAYINRRYDCADFALHGLLRLYHRLLEHDDAPAELMARMKTCILGFKYWEDEPGPSMMFTRSENHEILFHSAEYLAGLLFPGERFASSGQNGLFHIQKGKRMAERWIQEKGRYGFMEWHSNTYYEEDILAMLNLYDFGEETGYMRILARQLLDLIGVLIATHSQHGVMGTTHGRCYEHALMQPELESMSHLNWLLLGAPRRLREDRLSIGAATLIDSGYAVPGELARIASSPEPLLTRTRMGLFPREGLGGVNCSTYRTADYMVSGLVESMAGRAGHQVQAGQVLLGGRVPVFVTCFDNKSAATRPSYWGGQYRNPKTVAYRNLLAYIYTIEEKAGYTHCYFPMGQLDEVAEVGDWLCGRHGDAYVAVYCNKPYTITRSGPDKDRELLCLEKRSIWLLEAGSASADGSFEAFARRIAGARLEHRGEDLRYDSPSCGELALGWETTCTAGGAPVLGEDHPLIDCPYGQGAYGSGLTRLRLDEGGRERILNFNL
ncbi:hypothetical protein IDH44_03135 [Paenibacillus sp. IB182496]|uniref:Uncharacterized protein n=1 Tax=Paenibacillus sabuli TaxID=2772509 RepID=A0A927GQR5_9BACL|nr:hypothetical protein [Paenibacillus sabuli]MBD2844170.1 hypothetical protein [Paenibacillus sabuli]